MSTISDHLKFSIIIPVYNKEAHLKRAVDSALSQEGVEFEIILILDPSTDNSEVVANSFFENSKVRIIKRNTPGPGGYAARNLGLEKSSNQYVAFLDADDEWSTGHLLNISKIISLYPCAGLYSTMWFDGAYGSRKICAASDAVRENSLIDMKTYLTLSLKNLKPITTSAACVDKNKLWEGGFFPAGRAERSGDIYSWSRCVLEFGSMAVSPKATVTKHAGTSHRVSKVNVPSFDLPRELQKNFSSKLKGRNKVLLYRFANRLWYRSWVEKVRVCGVKKPLDSYSSWFFSPFLFLKLLFLYVLPIRAIGLLRSVKNRLNPV